MAFNPAPSIPGDPEENSVLVIEEINSTCSVMHFATAPYMSVAVGDIVSFSDRHFGVVRDQVSDTSGSIRRLICGGAQVFRVDGIYRKVNNKGHGANNV